MLELSDERFAELIGQAMDELPEEYIKGLNNVVVTYENEPSPEQRTKLKLSGRQSLFGLYEGIPLTKRGSGYSMVLPDKITIFKNPLLGASHDISDLQAMVKHTLWHEVAHYYGLDHDRIHDIEANWR